MHLKHAFLPALLVLTLACGGGSQSSSPEAPSLVYTDPSGSGWRLVRNTSSTSGHLVLDLLGPAGTKARGVGLELTLGGTQATWAKVASSDTQYAHNVLFDLGTDASLQPFRGKAAQGDLKVGLYQKGTAIALDGPILSLAIDLKAGSAAGTAVPLALTVAKANCLAEGDQIVDLKGSIQVGTLQVQ